MASQLPSVPVDLDNLIDTLVRDTVKIVLCCNHWRDEPVPRIVSNAAPPCRRARQNHGLNLLPTPDLGGPSSMFHDEGASTDVTGSFVCSNARMTAGNGSRTSPVKLNPVRRVSLRVDSRKPESHRIWHQQYDPKCPSRARSLRQRAPGGPPAASPDAATTSDTPNMIHAKHDHRSGTRDGIRQGEDGIIHAAPASLFSLRGDAWAQKVEVPVADTHQSQGEREWAWRGFQEIQHVSLQ